MREPVGVWPSEWRPDPSTPRRIVCAAAMLPDGRVIAGPRHFDFVMRSQLRQGDDWDRSMQGFIDQFCAFLSRTEAWVIAEAADQIRHRCGGDTADGGTLWSENLY